MIRMYHVNKTYEKNVLALQDITLNIARGEFVFFTGSSGAGKTTLLKLLFCEERPTSGQILINNINITNIEKPRIPYLRRRIGFVFQDYKLFNNKTVFDNVAFALEVIGVKRKNIKTKVGHVLSMVGLSSKTDFTPLSLSGGEKQRVAIARSLIHDPLILLADEPTGNLDADISMDIINLLSNINAYGTTVVVTTHNKEMVTMYQKRVIGLEQGKVLNYKSPPDFTRISPFFNKK